MYYQINEAENILVGPQRGKWAICNNQQSGGGINLKLGTNKLGTWRGAS